MSKIISDISDINLKNALKELNRGCIYFIFKNKEGIDDVHIFTVNDGEIVSNVYTNGELWNVYGNTELAYEILHDINKKVLLYIVEDENVIGQLFISRETIRVKGDSKEIGEVLNKNRNILIRCCSDIYFNTPYIKYIQRVDKNKVRDFESYLKENKYYLVHINLSVLNVHRNGYLVYRGKKPVAAAYEDNYGILYGDIAYRKIKRLLEKNISIIDIYEYREDFVKSLLDSCPGMRVICEEKRAYNESEDISIEIEEDGGNIFDINYDISIEDVKIEETLSEDDLALSREELLKKFGLKDPDEEWVESILKEYYAPSFDELLILKKELENEIVKICSKIKGIKKINVSLEVSWKDETYIIEGDVIVVTKKVLGIIGGINPRSIRREIDNVIKRRIPTDYSLNISINIL
ncbi:hypothetical protein CFE53_04055 [Methanofervidicoccus sp. A16]|uniref:DUF2226 domain-containing protein n=1 Tax=Methanofervidicoccus sp. A16 TaxID=2607662 RepID=UPI001188798A|nr:DUF2226 domain-containing protein [Methanofervidicoccus sp. A16]AXI25357.1 hypothetical protein CFE53_04055 [Methanofervidicoccus sp. A16]